MNKQSAKINFLAFGGLPIVGILTSIILTGSRETWIIYLLSCLILILVGKVSQYKKGKWFSFGCQEMEVPYNYFYLFGWFLLSIAIIISIAVKTNV